MRESEVEKILQDAIDEFGEDAQMIMCIEEMSELTKELTKVLRGLGDVDHVAEEIADVLITVMQMVKLFDCEGILDKHFSHKMNRLKERLDKHKLKKGLN